MMTPELPPKSPFKFLDAYTAQDTALYFGRQAERKRLVELLFSSRLILVYGASGTGKTSLVQCGLAQAIAPSDYFPVVVRRRSSDLSTALLSTLGGFLGEANPAPTVQEAVTTLAQASLRPVYLIFDQFEELFISGTAAEQAQFFAQIKQLYTARIPCKILLVIREEYLAYLYRFEQDLPGLFDFRLRIEPLSERSVGEIIVGACRVAEQVRLDPEAETARLILENIQATNRLFQLPYLQVYLDRLWRLGAQAKQPEVVINPTLVNQVGAIGDVLERFLVEQKKAVITRLGAGSGPLVTRVLEAFVTYEGTRQDHRLASLRTQTGLTEPELLPPLRALEQARILREEDGTYELPLEVLARVIDQSRSLETRQLHDVLRRLTDTYHEYAEKKQPADLLLLPRRLAEIQWIEKALHAELARMPDGRAIRRFIKKSETFQERLRQQQIARLRRKMVAGFVLAGVLALASLAVFWAWQRTNAINIVYQTSQADPLSALLLRTVAYQKAPNEITEKALYESFYNHKLYAALLELPTRIVKADFTSDQKYILTQTEDHKMYLWDHSGTRVEDSTGFQNNILTVSYSENSKALLVLVEPGELYYWKPGKEKKRITRQVVNTAVLDAGGQQILTVSAEGRARLYNPEGSLIQTLASEYDVTTAAFSPDNQFILLTSQGGLHVWDRAKNRLVRSLLKKQSPDVEFVPNSVLALLFYNGITSLWNYASPEPQAEVFLQKEAESIDAKIAFQGRVVATQTAIEPASFYFWNPNGTLLDSLRDAESGRLLDFSPDGNTLLLLTSQTSKSEVLLKNRQGDYLSSFQHAHPVEDARFSDDGNQVLTLSNGSVFLWNREDSRFISLPHQGIVESVRFSVDGKSILTTVPKTATLWNSLGQVVHRFPQKNDNLRAEITPNGQGTLVNLKDKSLYYQNERTYTARTLFYPSAVSAVATSVSGLPLLVRVETAEFSADSRQVLFKTYNGKAWIHTLTTKKERVIPLAGVQSAQFSPDGKAVLLVQKNNPAVTIFEQTGLIRPLRNGANVALATFTPDGQRVVTTDVNGTIRRWTRAGTLIDSVQIQGGIEPFGQLVWPDGNRLLLAASGNNVYAIAWGKTPTVTTLTHPEQVQGIDLTKDGTFFVVQTEGKLYLRAGAGSLLLPFREPSAGAAFSPDHRHLATWLRDEVRLWPAPGAIPDWVEKNYGLEARTKYMNRAKRTYSVDTSLWDFFD